MKDKKAVRVLESIDYYLKTHTNESCEEEHMAINLAIKALKHESYWEDVKQALNDWLSNISSPQTALNDIYRAYMRTEAEK